MNKTSKSRTYPSPSVKKPSTSSSSTFNAVEVGRKSVDILVKKKLQRKQEWNDYLTEDNQFRITQEELLKKKQLLVSKHNILSEQYQPPKLKTKVKQLKTKIQHLTTNHHNTKEKDHTHTTTRVKLREEHQQHEKERGEQSTSLDLLELDSDEETEEDEISSDYDHIHHQSRSQSVRKHSNIADRSSSPVNHASTVRNLPFKPSKHQKSSQKKKFFSTTEKIPDDDLSNISKELILLFQELRYYEELSGKRSILQTDELMELLPEDELLSDQLDQKKVIRLLVNLVCQTMTYLLKNEVERATLSSEMELLKEKFHELQVSVLTRNTTTMPVFTSQPSLFSQQPPVTTHTTQTLPPPPPPPLATSSQSSQMMIEDGHNIITTPSISPIIPSSQHLPSDLMNRYLNISAMTSSPAVTNDDKSRAIPSSDGMVRRNLEMQFQSFETSSATPQRASTAANTTAATPIQSTPTTNKFTGSSPTDLLFSPNALSKFQKSNTPLSSIVPPPQPAVTSSTPPSALKVTPSDATVNKRTVDFNTTPLPSYQHADVSDFSTRTQDLLVSEYDHERVVRGYGGEADEEEEEVEEEEANNSFDYEAVMKLKNKYLMSMRDSTESTIERLSQQYANTLTHNSATHHQHQGKMREEQPSVGGPNVDIPMPVQAPQHPFAMTHRASAKDGKLHPMKNSSGLAVMPLLSEKRVHDVRNVSF